MLGILGQSLWTHLRPLAASSLLCFETAGKAADDPCTVGKESLIFILFFFFNQALPTATWTWGCVLPQLLPSSWTRFFFPLLKYTLPEVLPAWAWGCEVGLVRTSSTSPHGGVLLLTTPHRFVFVETLQAPWTCELLFYFLKVRVRYFAIAVLCCVGRLWFLQGWVNLGF